MSEPKIPEEFPKILKDFLNDLLTTFPELNTNIDINIKTVYENDIDDKHNSSYIEVFKYCQTVFPERFFDILYQNDSMFTDDNINTKFLPDIEFKILWKQDISDKTRDIIWKYLQLLLFIITNSISSPDLFGDTANLFSAVNEDEFKSKLEETIQGMHNMFDFSGIDMEGMDMSGINMDFSGINMDNLPKPEDMHDHINGLMGGKIGLLAKEIAEEVAKDLNINPDDVSNTQEVFQRLLKDPAKLMNLVKSVSKKLEDKIKSGEIKQSELLQEAGDMLKKMKEMPGMKGMQDLFKNMGMNMPQGGKMNYGAMENKLNSNMKQAKQRERMLQKLKEKKEMEAKINSMNTLTKEQQEKQDEEIIKVFSTGEAPERSARPDNNNTINKKKKKKKKPKN